MELSPKTKISAVLAAYPFIKGFLISINPNFKSLDNPVMMNTLGRMATLSQVAMVGGIELEELMLKLAREINKRTGDEIVVKGGAEPEGRQEILKGIIRDLHKGVDINILKKRFLDLIKDVSPTEIASMEQRLIEEGMPEDEVKRLCSVHVEVFKESLEKTKTIPGLPSGHPVHTLMLENRHAEGILEEVGAVKSHQELAATLEKLSAIDRHYLRKEHQLFPILEAKGISGPSKVMWSLHDDIRYFLKDIMKTAKSAMPAENEIKTLVFMINDMIYKEEHILFPMALETLTDDDWARVKKGEDEIGFAWIEPVEPLRPSDGAMLPPLPADRVGSLNLDTGQVTPEQVNLMLTHLPVDLSFVNEDDEVIYYSQTRERIFPRSPGIIGRKVQNCHPPKSVHVVEAILEAFKKGEKDVAEFWIQMKGRFIYIRYFAVRDEGGKYRGTLEVSQDVTEIRALSGDKRLLDWD